MSTFTLHRALRGVLALVACTVSLAAQATLSTSTTASGVVYQYSWQPAPAHDYQQNVGVTESSSSTGVFYDTTRFDYNPVTGDPISLPWRAETDALAHASAGYGDLHASALASINYVPASFSYYSTDWQKTWYNPLQPGAGASANAFASDTFTLTSSDPHLAWHAPVTVQFSLTLEASVSGCPAGGPYSGGAQASADLRAGDWLSYGTWGLLPIHLSASVDCHGPSVVTVTDTETLLTGRLYGFNDNLNAHASLNQYNCAPPACGGDTFLANASHTSLLHIDVLTPGVSLVADSGHDYASPVPEPTAAALMLAGLCGLATRRRPTPRKHGG